MLNFRGGAANAAGEDENRGPRSVEELLPESRPTRKNLEALADEIRSGKYASSPNHRTEVITKAGLMSTYLDMTPPSREENMEPKEAVSVRKAWAFTASF